MTGVILTVSVRVQAKKRGDVVGKYLRTLILSLLIGAVAYAVTSQAGFEATPAVSISIIAAVVLTTVISLVRETSKKGTRV